MSLFPLKPTSTYVKAYYAALAQFHEHGHTTEGNTRSAFSDLLKRCATPYDWHLVEEYQFKGTNKQPLRADGALVDSLTLVHGLWEAKDSADDLQKEIKSKVAKGYPLTNILFQSPDRAVLYQDNRIALDCALTTPIASSKSSNSSSSTASPTKSTGKKLSSNSPRRSPPSPEA
jgi:hypothetical protein